MMFLRGSLTRLVFCVKCIISSFEVNNRLIAHRILILHTVFFYCEIQVVFGFCISDCGGTGSNVDSSQAVSILSDLKTYNNGQFYCNGGAFFWVAEHDVNGAWSGPVHSEVVKTLGCSTSATTTQGTTTQATTTQSATTTAGTTVATTQATTQATTTTAACIKRGATCPPNPAGCCSGNCNSRKNQCT